MNGTDVIRTTPVFINVRDRLSCLLRLLGWLERAGHQTIILIDNASSYPPLVKFLRSCPHRVVHLNRNLGHIALWQIPEFRRIISQQWFVYTDPDVVPIESCPFDLTARLRELLERFPCYLKAGPGIHLDDIPDSYHLKQLVIHYESALYGREVAPGAFQADIDTTFALHRPHTPYILGPALRLRGKYEIHHLPWYLDSDSPDEEEIYYRTHAAQSVTTWNTSSDVAGLQCSPVGGGIAFEIESDPQALLRKLMRTNSGRMFNVISSLKAVLSRKGREKTAPADHSAAARQKILDILLSDEWMTAAGMVRRVDRLRRWRP